MNTRMVTGLVALTLLLAPPVRGVHASVGGPELAEVIGYEAKERKIYCQIHYHDESGAPPLLAYFDLGASEPCRLVPVPWSLPGYDGAPTRAQEWAALERRLTPLAVAIEGTIPNRQRVLAADTLVDAQGSHPRFRVEVRGPRAVWDGMVEVTTFVSPEVRFVRVYRLPEHRGAVGIVSFRGVPFEDVYEVQVPVLLDAGCRQPPIGWKPH